MTPQRALLSRLAAHVACPVVLIPEWCRNTREMLLNSMRRAGESLVADMHSLSVRLGLRRLRPWSAVDGAVQVVAQSVLQEFNHSNHFPDNPACGLQAQWLSKGVPAGADRTPSGESSSPLSSSAHCTHRVAEQEGHAGPTMGQEGAKFDPKQLDRLVCPLSKAKLRYACPPAANKRSGLPCQVSLLT